jgi:hypothetical protein
MTPQAGLSLEHVPTEGAAVPPALAVGLKHMTGDALLGHLLMAKLAFPPSLGEILLHLKSGSGESLRGRITAGVFCPRHPERLMGSRGLCSPFYALPISPYNGFPWRGMISKVIGFIFRLQAFLALR